MLWSHGSDVSESRGKGSQTGRGEKKAAVDQQKWQQKNQTQGGSVAHGSWTKVGAQCVWQLLVVKVDKMWVFASDVASGSFVYSESSH